MGRVDVGAMLDEMTVGDWFGWLNYYNTEPWGGERDDMRHEVLRLRLLGSFANMPADQLVGWEYPHGSAGDDPTQVDEVLELAEKRRRELATNG